ncbi:MAG: hypothetical protein AMXMBFR33_40790 [Candidatus Xenobia bacterium]
MKRWMGLLAILWALTLPALGQGHYQPGALPLKALTNLPPFPGVYFAENLVHYDGSVDLSRTLLNGRIPANLSLNASVFAANNILVWLVTLTLSVPIEMELPAPPPQPAPAAFVP